MSVKFQISLDEKSFLALRSLAEHEFRDLRVQAAVIIRNELERTGHLIKQDTLTQSNIVEVPNE